MKKITDNWETTPLFHAETKIINTPTKSNNAANCPGWDGLRFNIGNIHEIKKIRNLPAQS
ncbi:MULTISPECIES: hypothetical protein [unclassified Pseudomonas]|uniref:hypothetical protein n=1 Tax=unclassified Pseudomonas TaxID=196821 RepID=UPI000A1E5AA6|nr:MULTISPECIES: hypothetical protein [unclassified Pseudomonas]